MFLDDEHPDIPLPDWDAFKRWGSPYLIEEILDRNSANLPDWFVPLARGAATPSRYLLRHAGYSRRYCRPSDWRKDPDNGSLYKAVYNECMIVTPCGPLWRIEREGTSYRPHRNINHPLAHVFGPTPILARNVQAAICLVEYYFLNGVPAGLTWAQGCPDDLRGAIEYAKQRCINEAVLTRDLLS
jgi:hypothetical protein